MKVEYTQYPFVVLLAIILSAVASAGPTFSFQNVTNNSSINADAGEAQLSVELIDLGSNAVEFLFSNVGPAPSSITDIYFDNGGLGTISGPFSFVDIVGNVSFSPDAAPGNLPGGNDIGFSSDLSADSVPAAQPNGVNPTEAIGLALTGDYASVLNDIIAGNLRIGLHVQGFTNGGSESFVNTPPSTVPSPGAIMLGGMGISLVGFLRRRKNALLQ